MRKRSLFERVVRALFRLPAWARPAIVAGAIVLAIMIPRVAGGLCALASGKASTSETWLALAAGPGAGFLGGLIHGLSRPALRRLGVAGDYLSGVVILYAYLGALLLDVLAQLLRIAVGVVAIPAVVIGRRLEADKRQIDLGAFGNRGEREAVDIGAERAEHRVDSASFEQGFTFVGALQPLGNVVAVQILVGGIEDGEKNQRHQSGVELLLELPGGSVIHPATIHFIVLAVN